MPVYLTRWPNGSLSLTQAQNRADLMHLLDMEGSAAGCRVVPVTNSFSLSIEPPTRCGNNMQFEIDFANADSGCMLQSNLEAFWPNLKKLIDDEWDADKKETTIPDREWREARERDLNLKVGEPKLNYSFQATIPNDGEPEEWLAVTPNDLPF
jgi:hypothetical protein